MAGLQRSQVSFRRQGSSGFVWDDKLLQAELNKTHLQDQDQENFDRVGDYKAPRNMGPINTLRKSRSTGGGGKGYRTGKVSPAAIEPPSPRLSVCGCCTAFGNKPPKAKTRRARTDDKPRSR